MATVTPFDPDKPLAKDKPGNGPRFVLIPFDQIKIDTIPSYRVKGILPQVGLCIVWGPPKCGKSFLVFDIVMHVALGWKYRGKKVRQGSVVYCALEGCAPFKNRIEAFRKSRLANHAGNVPFDLMASPMTLVADHSALIECIRLRDLSPAIVVIDTLNRSLAGSESSDEDMSAYIRAADAVRDAFNCLVIIVHHCGHDGNRPRGHSSLLGALDVELAVKRDAADNVIAMVELMKDGPQGEEWASRLEVVELGEDDDGDKITSCIVSVEGLQPSAKASPGLKLTKAAKNALSALHYAIGETGKVPPASNHIPANMKCVTADQWREYAYRMAVSSSEEPRARQKAFKAATEALIAAGHVGAWNPWVWAK